MSNNCKMTDELKISQEFNNYFINVGPSLASKVNDFPNTNYHSFLNNPTNKLFKFRPVNEKIVLKELASIKSKTSAGYDNISSALMKKIAKIIIKPLTIMINQCMKSGIFPKHFKIAKVVPIYKGNELNKNTVNSYRPISLLPAFSKIFEKIIYNQLYEHLDSNNLLYNHQYGFQPKKSTELASLELADRLVQLLDSGFIPITVFLDLSKAFDTIDHNILIQKLNFYGISGTENQLFQNYLHNRKQYVSVDNHNSSMLQIKTGVPQGSILGPLLFLIYINDFYKCTNLQTVQYADDTCLVYPFQQNTNTLYSANTINTKLHEIYIWLSVNKLSLNISKTKFIVFHFPQRVIRNDIPALQINNIPLVHVRQFKFLGILFDNNLSWANHINSISTKCTQINGVLNKLKYFFPPGVLKMIYYSLIHSHMTYGILLWGFKNISRLQHVQKKSLRIISNTHYFAHTAPICKRLNIVLLEDIVKISVSKFYYKFVHQQLPQFFQHNFISPYNRLNPRPARDVNHTNFYEHTVFNAPTTQPTFHIPFFKKNMTEHCLRIQISKLINEKKIPSSLLDNLPNLSLQSFSFAYKKHLLQYYFECNIPNCFSCNYVRR